MPLSFSGRTKLFLAAIMIAATPVLAYAVSLPKPADAPATPAEAAPATDAPAAEGTFQGFPVTEFMDVSLLDGADIDRGQKVYTSVGICLNCHGWNGDGMGKNPRSEGEAAKLRESQLDTQSFIDIISCGIPGSPMPFHNMQAYKNPDICFGQTMADFDGSVPPRKGKSIRPADLINLVAYIQTKVQGAGETTLEQCQDFYGDSASKTCTNLE